MDRKGLAEGVMTMDEVAAMLSVHPRKVRRLIDAGKLEGLKLDRHVRVPKRSVLDYLESCRMVPGGGSSAPVNPKGGKK